MAHPNEETTRKAADALASGDMDTFMALHTDDVVAHTPMGEVRGIEALGKSFQDRDAMLDGRPTFELHDILANDDHAVVLGTEGLTKDGKTFDLQQVVVIHMKDGKFAEVWIHLADPQGAAQFLGLG